MNKIYRCYLFLFMCCATFASAQITIGTSDIPQFGDVLTSAVDTLPPAGLTIGSAGENQSWDFSQLQQHQTEQTLVLDPATTPYSAAFPSSNMALQIIITEGQDTLGEVINYLEVTSSAVNGIGFSSFVEELGNTLVVPFNPSQKILELPTTYGTSFTDNYRFEITVDGESLMVDSLRIIQNTTQMVEIDAYGQLTTPLGTYNALRQKTIEITGDTIMASISGFWITLDGSESTDTSYTWHSKESKLGLINLEMDETGNISTVTYSLAPPSGGVQPPVAGFTFMDEGNGSIQFSDNSTNALSWSWDFGDGSMSSLQSPLHTYSENGDYNVCLTVANTAGEDTHCQMVSVMVTATTEAGDHFQMEVFPNPANEMIVIRTSSSGIHPLHLRIYNNLGQEVISSGIDRDETQISTLSWVPGIYFIEMYSEEGTLKERKRIVVNRK